MSEIVVACECCGRPGMPVGYEARIRCVRHEYVVDAQEWLRARSAMTYAFETEEELTAYLSQDYGAGLEMVRGLQRDPDRSDPATKH
ncbi:hypothetical protein [Agrobacterium sp. lyk4-40-TYG-31]|uniref:hypothetical protein n=1 Tax=Agrobacterium sp. lyk4-40-TYG-31 TaxID=3040276 RepID=UPI0013AED93A|nr:hypothetical protein [Agrobacterium sp. lyk4-40-TYG-31]